jgi:hypothetical protein
VALHKTTKTLFGKEKKRLTTEAKKKDSLASIGRLSILLTVRAELEKAEKSRKVGMVKGTGVISETRFPVNYYKQKSRCLKN